MNEEIKVFVLRLTNERLLPILDDDDPLLFPFS